MLPNTAIGWNHKATRNSDPRPETGGIEEKSQERTKQTRRSVFNEDKYQDIAQTIAAAAMLSVNRVREARSAFENICFVNEGVSMAGKGR